MYNFTHGLSEPGEQKDRNYQWPFEKNDHKFGKADYIEKDGAKKSLQTDLLYSDYPQTKIGTKRLEDFRQATASLIGRGKFKGTLNENISENFTFGVKTIKGDEWNVGKCLSGDSEKITKEMLEPDVDLGKSFNYTKKNPKLHPNKNIDYNRVFGVSSVKLN